MKKLAALSLIFACSSGVADSEFDSILADAIDHSPRLAVLDRRIQAAELAQQTADLSMYPSLNAGVEQSDEGPVSQLRLDYVLWDFGKRQAQRSQADSDVQRVTEQAQAETLEFVLELTSLLVEYDRLDQVIRDTQTHLRLHNELVGVITRRGDAGLTALTDVDQAQAWTDLVSGDLVIAQADRARIGQQIQRHLQGPLPAQVALPPVMADLPDVSVLQQRALANNAGLQAFLAQQRAAESQVEIASAERFPEISVNYQRNFGDLGSLDKERAFVALNTEFSPGFAELNQVKVAELELQALQSEIQDYRNALQLQVDLAHADWRRNQAQMQQNQALQDRLQTVVDATQRLAHVGRRGWLDVFTTLREVQNARLQKLAAQAGLNEASLTLSYLTGARTW